MTIRPTDVDKSHCEEGDRSLQISCIGPLVSGTIGCLSPRFGLASDLVRMGRKSSQSMCCRIGVVGSHPHMHRVLECKYLDKVVVAS
jgi:hypothetical protein